MSKLGNALAKIRTLEELAGNNTAIHRLHPMAKLITTFAYLFAVISFEKYDLSGLIPFTLYPVIMMSLSETPYRPLLARLLVALPFSFFAALSNVFLERTVAFEYAGISVSFGLISFVSVIVKTMLTVMAVLILAATTPMEKTAHELIRLKVPKIFVIQLMLTYRYIGALIEETGNMIMSYHMRSPRQKGIELGHAGTFVGQLILRSFDKAERIYYAMKCRGFDGEYGAAASGPAASADWIFTVGMIVVFTAMRLVNISIVLGDIMGRLSGGM